MKTGLKRTAEGLTLAGAIIISIIQGITAISSLLVLALPWTIFSIAVIVLTWVARANAVHGNSKGWSIYGLVQSVLCVDVIGFAGYICNLVDLSK